MKHRKTRSKKLEVGKQMPPLYHRLLGEEYSDNGSEVLDWIAKQPQLLDWIKEQLRSAGYIEYDPEEGWWIGVDYHD